MSYKDIIKQSESRLERSGFAQKHEARVTFKENIEFNEFDDKIVYNLNSTNQDADNILIKAMAYFSIPKYVTEHAKYLLAKTWNGTGQKQNYSTIKFELVAVACLIFCYYQDPHMDIAIAIEFEEFEEYVQMLFKSDKQKNVLKMWQAHETICHLNNIKPIILDFDRIVYTDGACRGNPGMGGWGVIILSKYGKLELYNAEIETTNNRMELMAAINGIEACPVSPSTVQIFTDSKYVEQGITDWIVNWKKNEWKTADGGAVKNIDLWKQLDILTDTHTVSWRWVKGHKDNPGNDRADVLANKAIDRLI